MATLASQTISVTHTDDTVAFFQRKAKWNCENAQTLTVPDTAIITDTSC